MDTALPISGYQIVGEKPFYYLVQNTSGEITTSVILPAFNEETALPKVLSDLCAVLDHRYEVLIIDDGSTDNTADVACGFECRVIQHSINRGKGQAVQTGIQFARGKYIIVMDADATYPATEIPKIVKLLETFDLVRGVRQYDLQNMPKVNRVGNLFFDLLLTNIIGLEGKDQLSGLYGLRRAPLLDMQLEATGFDLEAEINYKAQVNGLRVHTFPVDYYER